MARILPRSGFTSTGCRHDNAPGGASFEVWKGFADCRVLSRERTGLWMKALRRYGLMTVVFLF